MSWVLNSFLTVYLAGLAPAQIPFPKPAHVRLIMTAWEDQSAYDAQAEQALLELANQSRAQSGLKPLHMDEGLVRAARAHAAIMAERGELSHQFSGEPDLSQRLAATSSLYLVEAAENVAYAADADRAHDALMHSVHHRENLLHASYNVVGMGVVHSGNRLYVVQDFGNSEAKVSAQESETVIKDAIRRLRRQNNLADLPLRDTTAAHKEACQMAEADSLKVENSALTVEARRILSYTALQPGNFPSDVSKIISDGTLKSYTAGSCFARSKSYPNGVYWVVLIFY